MARILADTNIWLRIADPEAVQNPSSVRAIARLLAEEHELCICPQNLIEFWAVATRPVSANGLGWTTDAAAAEIAGLDARFTLLPDTPELFPHLEKARAGRRRLRQAHPRRPSRRRLPRPPHRCPPHLQCR
jgi:predicted nucleic acid-binding protein